MFNPKIIHVLFVFMAIVSKIYAISKRSAFVKSDFREPLLIVPHQESEVAETLLHRYL